MRVKRGKRDGVEGDVGSAASAGGGEAKVEVLVVIRPRSDGRAPNKRRGESSECGIEKDECILHGRMGRD